MTSSSEQLCENKRIIKEERSPSFLRVKEHWLIQDNPVPCLSGFEFNNQFYSRFPTSSLKLSFWSGVLALLFSPFPSRAFEKELAGIPGM